MEAAIGSMIFLDDRFSAVHRFQECNPLLGIRVEPRRYMALGGVRTLLGERDRRGRLLSEARDDSSSIPALDVKLGRIRAGSTEGPFEVKGKNEDGT